MKLISHLLRVTPACVLLLASAAGSPAFAQIDLQGEWAGIFHEDLPQRGGMRLGDYTGLPLNEAGIRKAMAWDEAARSTRERQCIPHVATYARRGPATIRLTKVTDIDSGRLIAYSPRRQLWTSANDLDGRPRASLGSRPVDADGLYVVSGFSRTIVVSGFSRTIVVSGFSRTNGRGNTRALRPRIRDTCSA